MWVLVLGAIIVIALYTVPAALKAGGEAWSGFWSDFWLPFADFDSNADFNSTANGAFAVVITYADGTTKDFQSLSIIPLRIGDGEDDPITQITLELRVKVVYVGTMTEWIVGSDYLGELKDNAGIVISNAFSGVIDKRGTALPNGVYQTVWSKTYTDTEIEAAANMIDGEQYALSFQLNKPVSIGATFQSGKKESLAVTTTDTTTWSFTYSESEGLKSLNVAFVGIAGA